RPMEPRERHSIGPREHDPEDRGDRALGLPGRGKVDDPRRLAILRPAHGGDRLLPPMLSPAGRSAETSCMGRMRGAGLIATVVMSAGLWLYGHGHGSAAPSASYCADVTTVLQTVTGTQAGSSGHPSPS